MISLRKMCQLLLTISANTVKRLSKHLSEGTPASATASYLHTVKRLVPSEPVVLIDESDIVKPDGKQFEALGIVRDGSESTQTKSVYKKGYHVTETCALTASKHPVSVFSGSILLLRKTINL